MSTPTPAALAAADQRYAAREDAVDGLLADLRVAIAAMPNVGPERLAPSIASWLVRNHKTKTPMIAAHALLRLMRDQPGGAR